MMIKRLKLWQAIKAQLFHSPYPVILHPVEKNTIPKGEVLFSYLEKPLLWNDDSSRMLGHTNLWESRTIAKIFQEFGYQVTAVSWSDREFIPLKKYDIVFDIFANLSRWAPYYDQGTLKLLHCTGSDPYYQNAAERQRVTEVINRRGGSYKPKRVLEEPEWIYRSLEKADACSLIGNEHTLQTYPERFWPKIRLVTVSASEVGKLAKKESEFVPSSRDFIWFFGSGAVHKGLDLVLEVFSKHTNLHLHVVGNVEDENDFIQIYRNELFRLKNIHYHGFLYPSSYEFQRILMTSFCFIAPSCSEGISPSVVTCMQLGLYPIISRDTGVTLPDSCGIYLEENTIDEIERQVIAVFEIPDEKILDQIKQTQALAIEQYSRKNFYCTMKQFISDTLIKFDKPINHSLGD